MRDPLGDFLQACTRRVLGNDTQSSAMYSRYVEWAEMSGEQVWSAKKLARMLKERGFIAKKSSVMVWCDIELTKWVTFDKFVRIYSEHMGA